MITEELRELFRHICRKLNKERTLKPIVGINVQALMRRKTEPKLNILE